MGTSFSASVQTSPEVHPAFSTMGTGSVSRGCTGWGVTLTTHPQLEPGFKVRVEFYLCTLSGLSWPVMGRSLPFFALVTL